MKMYPDVVHPNQAIYFGNVTQTDHEVGRLLRALDAMGRRDDTFVFFTSDNGPETLNRYRGSERSYGSPGPLRGMKLHMYEGGIRVPGIIRWPGRTGPGQVSREPINGTDVLPTLCALAGAAAPTDRVIDGASILPIFDGRPIERRVPLYWQYDRAIGEMKVTVREGSWKILANKDLSKFELYNLGDDPTEKRNLAVDQPRLLEAMSETLRALHEQIRAEGPKWPKGKGVG
jgi:arylsulfatase A